MTITTPTTYRAIWISDVHLGVRGGKIQALLEFLEHHRAEYLYLVGDIVDARQLRKKWFWCPDYSRLLEKILKWAESGTKIIYIPGNHDDLLRHYTQWGFGFGGVRLAHEALHTTLDGRCFLVVHGDQFDRSAQYGRVLNALGDRVYNFSVALNHGFNLLRRGLGYPYFSLFHYLKHKLPGAGAVAFIRDFEHAVALEARRRGVQGIICGHIHKAELRYVEDILYCNTGDWVESCTALVENHAGRLALVHWIDARANQVAFAHEPALVQAGLDTV